MKKSVFVLLAALVAVPAFAGAKCEKHPQNEWMPKEKLQAQLQQQGYTIKKFKVDGNCYEMYGHTRDGKKAEIYFDTKTGQPVKSEIGD